MILSTVVQIVTNLRVHPQIINKLLGSCDVPSTGGEALGECAHHNVHIVGVKAKVFDDSTAVRSDCADLSIKGH